MAARVSQTVELCIAVGRARRLGVPMIGSYNTDIPSDAAPFVKTALPWLDRRITRRIAAVGKQLSGSKLEAACQRLPR